MILELTKDVEGSGKEKVLSLVALYFLYLLFSSIAVLCAQLPMSFLWILPSTFYLHKRQNRKIKFFLGLSLTVWTTPFLRHYCAFYFAIQIVGIPLERHEEDKRAA